MNILRLIILITFALCIGCAASFPKHSAPAADIVIEDIRSENSDYAIGDGSFFLAMCPLVPYFTNREVYFVDYNFVTEVSKVVKDTQVFQAVTDNNSHHVQRAQAPLLLKVNLQQSRYGEVTTMYGLGFVGFALHVIGFPMRYTSTKFCVTVECVRREDQATAIGQSCNTDLGASWIYTSETSPGSRRIETVLRKALQEALAECLSNMQAKGFLQ